MTKKIVLVGCGHMGSAMLTGWSAKGSQAAALELYVVEPVTALRSRAETVLKTGFPQTGSSGVFATVSELPVDLKPDLIIFAVKPQAMADVLTDYTQWAGSGCLFLSIAAGLNISYFESQLTNRTPIVRCMPNTPAAFGVGMLVCCANEHVAPEQLAGVCALLEVCGHVRTVADESLMDAVTAISGSGPAYVFHLIETLISAGEQAGLSADLASTLAIQTVVGAGLMADQSAETPETLRVQVTSPGGTTAAALEVLRKDSALQTLMSEAVEAAIRRSRELGQ